MPKKVEMWLNLFMGIGYIALFAADVALLKKES